MSEHTHSFGYWLRRRRRALDLTQEQLAASVACSHFAIRKIEADERRPSKALAERLATRLEIPAMERERFLAAARGIRSMDGLALSTRPVATIDQPVAAAAAAPERAPPSALAAGAKFVGRGEELQALDQALHHARTGHAQIVMLAGQPGIGKTRTARELAAHATAAGMEVLWGRCPEEPGAPPYWPWVQLLRSYIDRHEPAEVASALASGARWIADIVPEAAPASASPADTTTTDAAQARFRLFDALAAFWKRAAAPRGIMLVIDDLHWADAASLRLLEFLAADATEARLLLVGTFRDTEVDRRHPLFDTLGDLARRPHYARMALRGLSLEEARELVGAGAATKATLTQLLERTEGNPFFLTEMSRLLAPARGGKSTPLPAGVREVIGSRLNRLSATCNQVLINAAVIGREFELPVLTAMDDALTEAACFDAIEEALAANVVEELLDAEAYRFTHALIREALYDEVPAIRRPRLHFRVAVAIEAGYRQDLTDQLTRLAFHYGAAMPAQGADKALEFARRAGEQAMRLFAYEEAARHFHGALEALTIQTRRAQPDPAMRCELLTLQGEAQTFAADYASARQTLRAAADLAQATASTTALARVAIAFEDASWRPGLTGEESIALLRSALARLHETSAADTQPQLQARLLSALTRALIFTGAADQAFDTNDRAVQMARQAGDARTLAGALCAGLSARWHPQRLELRLAAAREAIEIGRRIGDRGCVLEATPWLLFDLMERGIDDTFHREYAEYGSLCESMRQPFFLYTHASLQPALELMAGNLAASERSAEALRMLGENQPGLDAAGVYATQMFTVRREQGQLRELAPLVRRFVATTDAASRWRPGLALVYAELDMRDEARHEFDALATNDFGAIARDGMWAASIAHLAEVCTYLQDSARAPILYRLLLPYEHRNLQAGTAVACFGAASRFLGMLASTGQRWTDAERHFVEAIAMNERQGSQTWLAHSRYQYARMLALRARAKDRTQIRTLLAQARSAADAIGLFDLAMKIERFGPNAPT